MEEAGKPLSPSEMEILERQMVRPMHRFNVRVRLDGTKHELTIIAHTSFDAAQRAIETFSIPEQSPDDFSIRVLAL